VALALLSLAATSARVEGRQHPPAPKPAPVHAVAPAQVVAPPPKAQAVPAPAKPSPPASAEDSLAQLLTRRMREASAEVAMSRATSPARRAMAPSARPVTASRIQLDWRTGLVWPAELTDAPATGDRPTPRVTLVWK
jgi:hypothetical protein